MNHDDLERLLSDAFDASARARVGDYRTAPAFDEHHTHRAPARHSRRTTVLAPLAAAAAVVALVAGGIALFHGSPARQPDAAGPPSGHASSHAVPTTSATSASAGAPVHVRLKNADGTHVGVGMPVIAYFSRAITSAKALSAATTASVDGAWVRGAWYFEHSAADPKYPIEGHYRLATYWPAHAKIHMALPIKGLSAGPGLTYDDSLTLDFTTGAAHIVTVSDRTHTMTVKSDDKTWGTFPVSLGARNTPTLRGVKVIMEKGQDIAMRGPGYYDPHVKYTQRLTYGGEYLHAAPWNSFNIAHGIDSSNGCTNLSLADAKKLYGFLQIGDVVRYPDADGAKMQLGDGYGDWNVSWPQWQTGGAVPTS